ncbi:MAG: DUF4406 domain-containing protein [Planctomycetes bacterium]|jgi:nucleoside 2-deoxyribosyltransferase|nr:DUF4406 domain-containing protein [Planctomycetota bacterium]
MKIVYIAGPFRGDNSWAVETNIRRAEEAALEVATVAGMVPLCSHTMYRYFNGTINDGFWLKATAELLGRCDAVLMVGTWTMSDGAMAERELAVDLGIPVFSRVSDLATWLEGGVPRE